MSIDNITNKSTFQKWLEIINSVIDAVNGFASTYVTKLHLSKVPEIKSNLNEIESSEDGLYWIQEDTSTEQYPWLGRHIGEIFLYSGKDIPFGSLRLDGQSIVGLSGAFPDFKKWAIDDGNVVTCTLSEYETELTQYDGQCGKFGWDAATDTLRLPKISNFIGAAVNVSTISQSVKAGLPNITGSQNGVSTTEALTGAFDGNLYEEASNIGIGSNAYYPLSYIDFNASRSSAVYGRSDTVTPAHVKFPYFIHMYNSIVPASEAQVSEFTGLVDGLRQDVPELATHAASPSMKKIDFDVSQQSGTYLTPTDGYVFFRCQASVQNSWVSLSIQGTQIYTSAFIPVASGILTVWLPVSKGQTVTFSSSSLSAFTSRAGYFYYSNGNAPSA